MTVGVAVVACRRMDAAPPVLVAKYVARLQAATRSARPIIWVRTDGGHGELFYKSPPWGATVMSFALWQAGDPRYQPVRDRR